MCLLHLNLVNLIFAPMLYALRINNGASRRGRRDVTRRARGGLLAGQHGHQPACGRKCESTALSSPQRMHVMYQVLITYICIVTHK